MALTGCPGPRQGIDSTAAHSTPGSWILLNLAPHLPGTCVPRGRCGGRARRRPPPPEVGATRGVERMSAGRSLVPTTSSPLHSLIILTSICLRTPSATRPALLDWVTPSLCGDSSREARSGPHLEPGVSPNGLAKDRPQDATAIPTFLSNTERRMPYNRCRRHACGMPAGRPHEAPWPYK